MISTEKATEIILSNLLEPKMEQFGINLSLGYTLAQDVVADRDFPPYNRVTMDGIAINFQDFEKGNLSFKIINTQYAGDFPISKSESDQCIEIMTGAALHEDWDTIVRYEDIDINNGYAHIRSTEIKKGQNIHIQGQDAKKGDILVSKNAKITPPVLALLATVGVEKPHVFSPPKVAIIATGDEIVCVNETPQPHQIRGSNTYAIASLLSEFHVNPQVFHLIDNKTQLKNRVEELLHDFDVLVFSGGVSMGKKDFLPDVLSDLGVEKLFHKINQKPGKPFWMGRTPKNIIFGLPGNPVSTFLCTVKYVKPWFRSTLKLTNKSPQFAQLDGDVVFKPAMTYFLQVSVHQNGSKTIATPLNHHGSGDFINLTQANAFIELPASQEHVFKKGQEYEIYYF